MSDDIADRFEQLRAELRTLNKRLAALLRRFDTEVYVPTKPTIVRVRDDRQTQSYTAVGRIEDDEG